MSVDKRRDDGYLVGIRGPANYSVRFAKSKKSDRKFIIHFEFEGKSLGRKKLFYRLEEIGTGQVFEMPASEVVEITQEEAFDSN